MAEPAQFNACDNDDDLIRFRWWKLGFSDVMIAATIYELFSNCTPPVIDLSDKTDDISRPIVAPSRNNLG